MILVIDVDGHRSYSLSVQQTPAHLAASEAEPQNNEQCIAKDDEKQPLPPFSMASYKRFAFNDHLLEQFISKLDLNSTLIKSHPNYENLSSYSIIAA